MTTIVKVTTFKSGLESEVLICNEDENGNRDAFETLRIPHASDSTPEERANDIDEAISLRAMY